MLAPPDLPEILASVVSDTPTRAQTRRFVEISHRVARAYLRQKQRRRRLAPSLLHLPLDDLALDCIAELFERDEDGRFVQLVRYFEDLGWRALDADALFSATRRLVFSAVNDRLFACYGEADPALAKHIRNLKRAAGAIPYVTLERRAGVSWLFVDDAEPDARPLMPPELLEAYLTGTIRPNITARDLLEAVADVLRSQQHYARRYPLTALAQILRTARVRVHEATSASPATPDPLVRDDAARLITQSVAATEATMMASYVEKNKLDAPTYTLYFRAIHDRLTEEYVRCTGQAPTNYEALHAYLPGLSQAAYGQKHRAVFEYLSKRTREHFVKSLQREMK